MILISFDVCLRFRHEAFFQLVNPPKLYLLASLNSMFNFQFQASKRSAFEKKVVEQTESCWQIKTHQKCQGWLQVYLTFFVSTWLLSLRCFDLLMSSNDFYLNWLLCHLAVASHLYFNDFIIDAIQAIWLKLSIVTWRLVKALIKMGGLAKSP